MSKAVTTTRKPGLGRPGTALVGGLEAGGTHIRCVVGTVDGEILDSTAFNTAGPDETIARALGFFSGLRDRIRALGIAHFGPVDIAPDSPRFGHVLTTPKQGWADHDVVSDYRRGLAVPIAFQSDVNAAAIGEGTLGAAQGLRHYVYVTVGTGIGAGVVVNGQLLHDARHPEVGHMLVGRDVERDTYPGCCPFHGDCLEGLASGTALQGRWGVPGEQLPPVLVLRRFRKQLRGRIERCLIDIAQRDYLHLGMARDAPHCIAAHAADANRSDLQQGIRGRAAENSRKAQQARAGDCTLLKKPATRKRPR